MPVHYNYAIHAKLLTKCPKLTEQTRETTCLTCMLLFYNNNHSPKLYNFQGFIYQPPTTQNCAQLESITTNKCTQSCYNFILYLGRKTF